PRGPTLSFARYGAVCSLPSLARHRVRASMPDDPIRPPLPPGRRVPLPGRGTTWVVEAGPERAPTLVLLHGLGATAALNWFRSIRPLGARFRALAIDQRAPGRGIRPNRPSRLKDCPP